MRISDWSSDVCSSDLGIIALPDRRQRCLELCRVPGREAAQHGHPACASHVANQRFERLGRHRQAREGDEARALGKRCLLRLGALAHHRVRSEEHTSELQSLMRTSYAVFCLTKKKKI